MRATRLYVSRDTSRTQAGDVFARHDSRCDACSRIVAHAQDCRLFRNKGSARRRTATEQPELPVENQRRSRRQTAKPSTDRHTHSSSTDAFLMQQRMRVPFNPSYAQLQSSLPVDCICRSSTRGFTQRKRWQDTAVVAVCRDHGGVQQH
jgi:anti-sigma factor RsiW